MRYMSFFVWLTSLSIKPSRSIYLLSFILMFSLLYLLEVEWSIYFFLSTVLSFSCFRQALPPVHSLTGTIALLGPSLEGHLLFMIYLQNECIFSFLLTSYKLACPSRLNLNVTKFPRPIGIYKSKYRASWLLHFIDPDYSFLII